MAVRVILLACQILSWTNCSMHFSPTAQNSKLQQIIILICVVVLFLPFTDKAYHIDDPVYIWVARQILRNPLDFFGFTANWYSEVEHGARISVSPPLYSYYLALPGSLFNWAEIPLHVASIVPAIAVAFGTYRLAGCLKSSPLTSALLAVCTPLFLLCGTSVMVDMAMTAFYVWAIYFWITGLETAAGSTCRLTCAAILIVFAGLTKYFAMSLIPLLAVYPLWRRLPFRRWLPFLVGPLVMFVLYQYWTKQLYGFGHITHASDYAASYKKWVQISPVKSVVDGLSFSGGGVLIPIAFAPLLISRRLWLPLSAGMLALALLLKVSGIYGPLDTSLFFIQLVVFVAAGICLLASAVANFQREKDAGSLLLLCWTGGVFVFCTLINPVVAGRYLLPLVPAAAIIAAKNLELRGKGWNRAVVIACSSLLVIVSLLVTYADYCYANAVRSAARNALQVWAKDGNKLFFQGHWGLQYYLEEGGGTALSQVEPQAKAGDLVVTPSFGSNASELNPDCCTAVERFTVEGIKGFSTFNGGIGAGFHNSLFGPLPYAFGAVKPDSLYIHKVKSVQSRD